jgi:molybdenum cofactor synthesis domain-containing protein
MRVGVLTVSDRGSRGEREDRSGPLIGEIISERLHAEVLRYQVVPDEEDVIAATLVTWADDDDLDLILTTGGTGFAPRDVTPEATEKVIQRRAPGLVEAIRAESRSVTPHAMLSRAVAGIRGGTLIVNLPGSPKAVQENLEVILPALPHGVEILRDLPGADSRHEAEA